MLLHLVQTGDAQIDSALADEGRDIGGGKKDEGDREVLDEGDVEAVLSPELYVCTLEQVKCGLL